MRLKRPMSLTRGHPPARKPIRGIVIALATTALVAAVVAILATTTA